MKDIFMKETERMNFKEVYKDAKVSNALSAELVFKKIKTFFTLNYEGNFTTDERNKELKFDNVIEVKTFLSTKLVDTVKFFKFNVLRVLIKPNYVELNFGLGGDEEHWAKTRLYLTEKVNPTLWFENKTIDLI